MRAEPSPTARGTASGGGREEEKEGKRGKGSSRSERGDRGGPAGERYRGAGRAGGGGGRSRAKGRGGGCGAGGGAGCPGGGRVAVVALAEQAGRGGGPGGECGCGRCGGRDDGTRPGSGRVGGGCGGCCGHRDSGPVVPCLAAVAVQRQRCLRGLQWVRVRRLCPSAGFAAVTWWKQPHCPMALSTISAFPRWSWRESCLQSPPSTSPRAASSTQ